MEKVKKLPGFPVKEKKPPNLTLKKILDEVVDYIDCESRYPVSLDWAKRIVRRAYNLGVRHGKKKQPLPK